MAGMVKADESALDTVSFKVFVFFLKEAKHQIRRFEMDRDKVGSFYFFITELAKFCKPCREYIVTWKDSDGDKVNITTDEEFKIALAETKTEKVRKFYVTVDNTAPRRF